MTPSEMAEAARALLGKREPRSADDLAAAIGVERRVLLGAFGAVRSGLERCAPPEGPEGLNKAWWWRRTFIAAHEAERKARKAARA